MVCLNVIYRDFRNIQEADIAFSPGINMIAGDNAMGKTSALEGIFFCAQGKSHRAGGEAELVRFGQPAASVTLRFVPDSKGQGERPERPEIPERSEHPEHPERKHRESKRPTELSARFLLNTGVLNTSVFQAPAGNATAFSLVGDVPEGVPEGMAPEVSGNTFDGKPSDSPESPPEDLLSSAGKTENAPEISSEGTPEGIPSGGGKFRQIAVKKQYYKNGLLLAKASEFIGHFRAVLFTPDHLSLVKGAPALRRQFLDAAISQLDRAYLVSLQRYRQILQNRNLVLADAWKHRALIDTLDGWDALLAKEAAEIAAARARYVTALDREVRTFFADMTAGRERPSLSYPEPLDEQGYLSLFQSAREREIRRGVTLFGPHRDDILLLLEGREARNFASQGQQRSFALAMKLAEGELSRAFAGEYPVFLFDDVFSELDNSRRAFLLSGLAGRQVIMTACRTDGLSLPPDSRLIFCEKGKFYPDMK